jgi:hypothetical protein
MQAHIAFLHTSPVHVATFDRLVNEAEPNVRVSHFVAEDLLADAQRLGSDDPALIGRVQAAMAQAAASGATIVVCTCSTIGGAAERMPAGCGFIAARIDRAMADRAVALGPRVLIVAATESTLSPTAALIEDSAKAMQRPVQWQTLLVPGAWAHFTRGDQPAYLQAVTAAVREATAGHDVVVLAQASMAPVADTLGGLAVPVLASPNLGVQRALTQLHKNQ